MFDPGFLNSVYSTLTGLTTDIGVTLMRTPYAAIAALHIFVFRALFQEPIRERVAVGVLYTVEKGTVFCLEQTFEDTWESEQHFDYYRRIPKVTIPRK